MVKNVRESHKHNLKKIFKKKVGEAAKKTCNAAYNEVRKQKGENFTQRF